MLTCKIQGGLGNQLFQIFTTLAMALRFNKPFFFLNNYQLGNGENGSTIRYTYWETFLSSLKPFLKNLKQIPELTIIKENSFKYENIEQNIYLQLSKKINNGIVLVGYFQSPLYFEKYKNMICKLIKLEEKKIAVKNKIQLQDDFLRCAISLHFRLGDYKKLQDFHPILSEKYYINCISYILSKQTNKNLKVLYFCEDEDFDEVEKTIKNLEIIFPLLNFTRCISILEDWEQLLLMSMCSNNIIANSTFSWWSAYLNNNPEKIVCYPDQWFGPRAGHDTSDLFPKDWIKIETND
jgi:hypothetical protein